LIGDGALTDLLLGPSGDSPQAGKFRWATSGAAMIQRKFGFTDRITVCDPFSLSIFEFCQISWAVLGRRLYSLLVYGIQISIRSLIALD
jgi:hypothetical protein